MKILYISIFTLAFFACSEEKTGATSTSKEVSAEKKKETGSTKYTFKAIYLGNLGWGYQVFNGSKLLINQQHVPAVNGMHGFQSQEKAEIAAQFVLGKIKEGWDKPTVSPEELDSLGAINLDSLNQILPSL